MVKHHVVQRHGGCPIHGHIQGQAGLGSEQPDLAVDIPADNPEDSTKVHGK